MYSHLATAGRTMAPGLSRPLSRAERGQGCILLSDSVFLHHAPCSWVSESCGPKRERGRLWGAQKTMRASGRAATGTGSFPGEQSEVFRIECRRHQLCLLTFERCRVKPERKQRRERQVASRLQRLQDEALLPVAFPGKFAWLLCATPFPGFLAVGPGGTRRL